MKKTFLMTFSFFALLWMGFSFFGKVESPELQRLNWQIEQLEAIERGYESRAIYHENQAQRLQFQSGSAIEVKRHYKLAEANRKKATEVQNQIDELKKRRETLLHNNSAK